MTSPVPNRAPQHTLGDLGTQGGLQPVENRCAIIYELDVPRVDQTNNPRLNDKIAREGAKALRTVASGGEAGQLHIISSGAPSQNRRLQSVARNLLNTAGGLEVSRQP